MATINKPNNEEPLLLGHQIPNEKSNFCWGGPGYVLKKMSVKRLIKDALPTCYVSYGSGCTPKVFIADVKNIESNYHFSFVPNFCSS